MKTKITTHHIEFIFPEFLDSWAGAAKGEKMALAARLLADCEVAEIPSSSDHIKLPTHLVAAWPESIAVSAGLPRNCPFGFDLRLSSGLGQIGTSLSIRWLKPSTSVPLSQSPTLDGLLISLGAHAFRIQEPYFTVLGYVDEFNEAGRTDPQEQFRIWAHIRSALGEETVGNVTDSFLRIFRVTSADSLTFSFTTDANGDLQIDPVLLTSQFNIDDGTTGKVRALLESEESTLISRLDSLATGASSFPLSNGTYVVVPLVINGEVNTSTRQDRVDDFQSRDGFDVMILSPKAGGVGITLTAANHVIHLSRWWNPAVEDQCSDRAYRIGQTKDVHIYYPMAINPGDPESSFDLKLDELMTRKRVLSQQLLAPPTITKQDYESLLSQVKG